MPEWLSICLAGYVAGVVLIVFVYGITMPPRRGFGTLQRARHARIIIAAPLWPLAIPYYIAYGIYRLIQIARTGE